jgi:hypothetical protein
VPPQCSSRLACQLWLPGPTACPCAGPCTSGMPASDWPPCPMLPLPRALPP